MSDSGPVSGQVIAVGDTVAGPDVFENAGSALVAHTSLESLCLLARLHHIAADAGTLAHQLGLSLSEELWRERWVVLAQCDGQSILFQDPQVSGGGRPIIEPLEVFAQQWAACGKSEMLVATSRASLMGTLAKFDFNWFMFAGRVAQPP